MADAATPAGRVAVCPHCGTKLSVAGVPPGKALRCGHCKQLFKLRAPSEAPPSPPSPPHKAGVTSPAAVPSPSAKPDALRTSRPPHPLARGASPVTAKPAAPATSPSSPGTSASPAAKPVPAPRPPAAVLPIRPFWLVGSALVVVLAGWALVGRGGRGAGTSVPETSIPEPPPPLEVVMAERFRVPVEVSPQPASAPSSTLPSAPRRSTVTARYDFSTGTQRQVWRPAYLVSQAPGGGCLFRLAQGAGTFALDPRVEPPFRIELRLRIEGGASSILVLTLDEGDEGRSLSLDLGPAAGRALVTGAVGGRKGPRAPIARRVPLQEGRSAGLPLDGSPFSVVFESGDGGPPAVTVSGSRVRWDGPSSTESVVLAAAAAPWGRSRLGLQAREVRSAVVVGMDLMTTVTEVP